MYRLYIEFTSVSLHVYFSNSQPAYLLFEKKLLLSFVLLLDVKWCECVTY